MAAQAERASSDVQEAPRTMGNRRRITKARCKICAHADRARIELAHVSGASLKSICQSFDVPRMAVWRHCTNHLTVEERSFYLADVDVKALAERANAENMSLLDYLAITRGVLVKQLQIAAGVNDRPGTAAIAGRIIELLKLSANLTGELQRLSPSTVTNNVAVFVASPAYADLSAMLVKALAGHPEALQKVLAGLDELEAKATQAHPATPLLDLKADGGAHAAAA